MKDNTKTRMTIFIKVQEEMGLLWSSQSSEGKYNIGFGISIKFQVKEENNY